MNHPSPAAATWDQDLLELEMHIARRADVLARANPAARSEDRDVWRRAETEVIRLRLPSALPPG